MQEHLSLWDSSFQCFHRFRWHKSPLSTKVHEVTDKTKNSSPRQQQCLLWKRQNNSRSLLRRTKMQNQMFLIALLEVFVHPHIHIPYVGALTFTRKVISGRNSSAVLRTFLFTLTVLIISKNLSKNCSCIVVVYS